LRFSKPAGHGGTSSRCHYRDKARAASEGEVPQHRERVTTIVSTAAQCHNPNGIRFLNGIIHGVPTYLVSLKRSCHSYGCRFHELVVGEAKLILGRVVEPLRLGKGDEGLQGANPPSILSKRHHTKRAS